MEQENPKPVEEMDAPKKEETPMVCTHLTDIDKNKLVRAIVEWRDGAKCFEKHGGQNVEIVKKDQNLRISLQLYKPGCSRYSEHQCLYKLFQKVKKCSLTLNPIDKTIWCYKCDMSLTEMRILYDEMHEDGQPSDEYELMVAYENEIVDILNQVLEAKPEDSESTTSKASKASKGKFRMTLRNCFESSQTTNRLRNSKSRQHLFHELGTPSIECHCSDVTILR